MKLFWDAATCNIHLLNTLRVARWTGSLWTNLGSVTTTGTASSGSVETVTNQSTFGYFMIAKNGAQPTASAGTDKVLCEGSNATIGGSPSASGGYAPYTYSWSPTTGLSSATVANPVASPTTTTLYILTITDADGTVKKDTVVFTVWPKPIADAGSNQSICYNHEFNIGGNPTASIGTTPFSYLWVNSNVDTVFQVSNPLIVADTSFLLYLTVIDSNGCHAEDSIEILVHDPINIDLQADTTLYLSKGVLLNPTVSGGEGTLTYTWSPDLWLNDSRTLSPTCTPFSTVHYTFTVTDSLGCSQEDYATINFRVVDLGSLGGFAAFAMDSIIAGDSSVAVGDVGSLYIEPTNLHIAVDQHLGIEVGNFYTERNQIEGLDDELSDIIDRIDNMAADTIYPDLGGITLTSGVYRIINTASLDGILTLEGNDSSYFIFDMDSNWIVNDFSKILHENVNPDKVFFSVNGEIIMGDSLELNCIFCCNKKVSIGSYTGHAAVFSNRVLSVAASALKLAATESEDCHDWSGFHTVVYPELPNLQLVTGGPANPDDYILVFQDLFNDNELQITTNWDQQWQPNPMNRWFAWGGWGYVDRKALFNMAGETTYWLDPIKNELKLRLTRLATSTTGPLFDNNDQSVPNSEILYASSQIHTSSRFYHGYFEIRAKQPSGKGMWPSFWVIEGDCLPNEKREIDFFDTQLKKTQMTMAQHPNACLKQNEEIYNACFQDEAGNPLDLSSGWHIYAADWNDEKINFYVDGISILEVDNKLDFYANRNQAMFLVLANDITPVSADNPWSPDGNSGVGFPNPDEMREFQIDYVKVWQKEDHLCDMYFIDDNTGLKITPDLCSSNTPFHIVSAYIHGATYEWTLSDGLEFSQNCATTYDPYSSTLVNAQNVFEVWVCAKVNTDLSATDETITLKITLPQIGNQLPLSEEQTIHLGVPAKPIFDDAETPISVGEFIMWDIYPVLNADGYDWTFEPLGSGATSDGLYLTPFGQSCSIEGGHSGSYRVKVRSHNDCGYSAWSQLLLYVDEEGCSPCKIADSTKNSLELNIYPNPGDGTVWIENNFEEEVMITIRTLSGITVSDLTIPANERIKFSNLVQGLLIVEATNKDYSMVERKLVSVIKP